jgi:hypothetical protein
MPPGEPGPIARRHSFLGQFGRRSPGGPSSPGAHGWARRFRLGRSRSSRPRTSRQNLLPGRASARRGLTPLACCPRSARSRSKAVTSPRIPVWVWMSRGAANPIPLRALSMWSRSAGCSTFYRRRVPVGGCSGSALHGLQTRRSRSTAGFARRPRAPSHASRSDCLAWVARRTAHRAHEGTQSSLGAHCGAPASGAQ